MTCTAAQSRAWRAKRRRESARLIQRLKEARPCSGCGRCFRHALVKFDGDEPGPLSSEARIREWADGRDLICAGCRRWRSWRLAWAEVLERHSAPGDPLVPPLPREAASYLRLAGASPEAVAAARAAVEQWERDWPAKAKRGVQPGSYKKGLAPHAVRSTAEAE